MTDLLTRRRGIVVLSGLLALAGGAGMATAGAASPQPGASYRGDTDQGKACGDRGSAACAVAAKVSPDGATISRFKINWSADCGGGTRLNEFTLFTRYDVSARGTFEIATTYDDPAFRGLTGHHRLKLKGRFARTANGDPVVRGTFTDTIRVDSDGSTEHYTCRTGEVRWSASA